MESKDKVFWLVIGIIVAVALFFVIAKLTSNATGYGVNESDVVILAQCLASKGAKMYGLDSCPHCQDQKKIFGYAFQYIDYVRCEENMVECSKLSGVPAWKIGDKALYGTQSLEALKKASGCE